MKCSILEKAGELFLKYGFKSVTMDDIAHKMGISKKTIYSHFKNKNILIEEATMALFEMISGGIDSICENTQNPIEELFAVKKFTHENLKDESSSSHYQLQKYYPEIFHNLKLKQLELIQSCVSKNLNLGIQMGLYRPDLDVDFITRIYFIGALGLKDDETFPSTEYNYNYISTLYLDYHIRAIATEKGIQTLEKLLQKNEK